MNVDRCSLKLRAFTLVVNTADFINERATQTLGMSHALFAPVALFSTYIFLGIFVIGGIRHQYGSCLLQVYAIIVCLTTHICTSFVVFRNIRSFDTTKGSAIILNGILPLVIALMLLGDLVVLIFSTRPVMWPPSISASSRQNSQSQI